MKKKLIKEIEIPEGIEANFEGSKLIVKGPEGENSREFNFGKINFEKKENKIILKCDKATKTEKKIMNSISAHISNLIKGVQEKFEYQLKVCSSHFPMTVIIEGDEATIKNFLGEKINRKAKIPKGAEVEINKEIITIKSNDKEIAGQAAANFEKATKVNNRDIRIFQDGIYIINKAGREI